MFNRTAQATRLNSDGILVRSQYLSDPDSCCKQCLFSRNRMSLQFQGYNNKISLMIPACDPRQSRPVNVVVDDGRREGATLCLLHQRQLRGLPVAQSPLVDRFWRPARCLLLEPLGCRSIPIDAGTLALIGPPHGGRVACLSSDDLRRLHMQTPAKSTQC